MINAFRLTQVAASMSLLFGSSMILSSAYANNCSTYSQDGVCGLKEFSMTSPLSPKPMAWYFTDPTQDTAINNQAKAQNIYFASGTSSRSAADIQKLFIDGANLSGYYINASHKGFAAITLANNATVDWLEAGGSTTNTKIIVDDSTLNGANTAVDYDQKTTTPSSKKYASGYAIYLAPGDQGDADIDIKNNSIVNGRIIAGGSGTHNITLNDSQITAGSILLYNAVNNNSVNILNSEIDTLGAVAATPNAIEIFNLSAADTINTVVIDNSQLNGTVTLTAPGGMNMLSIKDAVINNTAPQKDGNAISLNSGKIANVTLSNSQLDGHMILTGSDKITSSIDQSLITGNIIANKAALIALDITNSVVDGNIDTISGVGTVDLHLTDSRLLGDINVKGDKITESVVWLDNSSVSGHLYGSGPSSTLHLSNLGTFSGSQFSNFDNFVVNGDTTLTGGFTNENVGSSLTVSANTLTAPVQLSSGKLTLNNTKLIADTLSLSNSSSLALTKHSQLQTSSDQLFNAPASSKLPEGYNDTGTRVSFNDSTLILTDPTFELEYIKSINSLLGQTQGNTLVMLGDLKNAENAAGTASVADAATTGVVLANTQVTSSKNQLIIGAEDGISDQAIAVHNGFGASQLRFEGEGKPSVAIENGQSLTLTGTAGALIEVTDAPQMPVAVTISDGSFNLGVSGMQDVTANLTGTVTVDQKGAMNIVAGDHSVTSGSDAAGIVSSGRVSVQQQATLHADLLLQDQAQLTVNGTLLTDRLTASNEAQITVGDTTSAGVLTAANLDLQGARLFIDPAWIMGGTLTNASKVASGGSEINGRVTVGQNALLVLGDSSTVQAEASFANSGLTWGENDITAAVSIRAPQYLNSTQGGLRVDGSLTGSTGNYDSVYNTVDFADHSLLMVDSKTMSNGEAALTSNQGSLNVGNLAKLYVEDAKANQTYTIAKGFQEVNIADKGWQQDNLLLNKLLTAKTQVQNGMVQVLTQARSAQIVLPGVVTPNALDALISSGENDRNSTSAGQRFLSNAIDTPQVGVEQVVNTVNSAAQIITAGGVQRNTWAVGTAVVDAVHERNTIANPASHGSELDAGAWVKILFGNPHSSDLDAGPQNYGLNSNFYGLIVGADKTWESDIGTLRSGVAFHAGSGDSDSSGDFSSTHNDFSFWGMSLYQNWRRTNWNVTGDLSLSQTNSDLMQKQPGWIGKDDKLRGSVDSMLFSADLRGEYLIETDVLDIIPHAGVSYNKLTTKSFDTKNNQNESVFRTEKGTQNIWQFPIGVKFAKSFALDSGWNLRAQADAALVQVAGDRNSKNRLHTVGIHTSDIISAEIMDDSGFNGQLGVVAQKNDMTLGIGYNINASQHNTDQTIGVSWSLAF